MIMLVELANVVRIYLTCIDDDYPDVRRIQKVGTGSGVRTQDRPRLLQTMFAEIKSNT